MRASPTVTTALLAGLMAGAAPAAAQDPADPPKAITLSGSVTIVSDYRFRGISLSDKDFALQGALRADHSSGFYIATWGSSIEQLNGAEVELDVYGGWTGDFNGWKPDVGLYSYLYPGGSDLNYFEIYGALTREFGPVSATVGINYAPNQGNTTSDNTYVYGKAGIGVPGSPLSLSAGIGYENGAFADHKVDWNLGISATFGALTVGVSYVDTDQRFRLGDAGVVFSIGAAF
jgi:uncharacterized protein (TIGR02001 family)